ncbi:MAG: ferrous iron transporter B [Firmicutes bacterium]|nr:ferrous iron transporter B [Bacillota bacterium]
MNRGGLPDDVARLDEASRHVTQTLAADITNDVVQDIYRRAEVIARSAVRDERPGPDPVTSGLDNVLTSKALGFPVMFLLLAAVFWITLSGANYPSAVLASVLFRGQDALTALFERLNAPWWLHGVLVLGTYRSLAWVVSVMLPPMAIFFPCFTLLEDLGYLPRVAFNLDPLFERAGAHGKQALTMSMGFGCNAAGVIACRIIESPRERLIAILTNNFVPCNGRFPTLIALSSLCAAWLTGVEPGTSALSGGAAASLLVTGLVTAGIAATLAVSWLLARTILRGEATSFTMELPPYRLPQVGRVLVASILDRTVFVLARAVTVAAPAGAVVWVLANLNVGGASVMARMGGWLDPLGRAVGLDGLILLAFILGLPANEIVIPVLLMSYTGAGTMVKVEDVGALGAILKANGWTWATAACAMLFSLMHFPCGTTLLTIHKETGDLKWTALAALIPTAAGLLACFAASSLLRVVIPS